MKNGLKILSHEKRQASIQMLLPVNKFSFASQPDPQPGGAGVRPAPPGSQTLASQMPVAGFETIEQIRPQDSDYIYPQFRAISATFIEGHCIDYSRPGVLRESVPMLMAQTIYKNHSYWDVEKWLGVVSGVTWDEVGANSGGVPGINVELKIDAKLNPIIARGLMMTPPAIHSVSVTVVFEFDASHPDLLEQGTFWQLLGEEVEGQIVRLIATQILGYWEISLVFQGADALAKRLPDADDDDGGEELRRKKTMSASQQQPEKQIVKLTAQQKKILGLEASAAEEFDDAVVLREIESLAARASQADELVNNARTECLRVAALVEGGAEGKLPDAIAELIGSANPAQLGKLTEMYAARVSQKFPNTCPNCGAQSNGIRSSVESPEPEGSEKRVSVNVGSLH